MFIKENNEDFKVESLDVVRHTLEIKAASTALKQATVETIKSKWFLPMEEDISNAFVYYGIKKLL